MKAAKFALLTIVFATISCRNSASDFTSKKQIGVCQQNQGMIAYEVFLYADSTFYLPSDNAFIEESYGDFRIKNDTVYFNTTGGELSLCERYRLNRENDLLVPIDCPNEKFGFDKLVISFSE